MASVDSIKQHISGVAMKCVVASIVASALMISLVPSPALASPLSNRSDFGTPPQFDEGGPASDDGGSSSEEGGPASGDGGYSSNHDAPPPGYDALEFSGAEFFSPGFRGPRLGGWKFRGPGYSGSKSRGPKYSGSKFGGPKYSGSKLGGPKYSGYLQGGGSRYNRFYQRLTSGGGHKYYIR